MEIDRDHSQTSKSFAMNWKREKATGAHFPFSLPSSFPPVPGLLHTDRHPWSGRADAHTARRRQPPACPSSMLTILWWPLGSYKTTHSGNYLFLIRFCRKKTHPSAFFFSRRIIYWEFGFRPRRVIFEWLTLRGSLSRGSTRSSFCNVSNITLDLPSVGPVKLFACSCVAF